MSLDEAIKSFKDRMYMVNAWQDEEEWDYMRECFNVIIDAIYEEAIVAIYDVCVSAKES
jgi:hypothetical protein